MKTQINKPKTIPDNEEYTNPFITSIVVLCALLVGVYIILCTYYMMLFINEIIYTIFTDGISNILHCIFMIPCSIFKIMLFGY